MLLIGIDEAGYGPILGPLCHGCVALRLPESYAHETPDLWALLHPALSRDGSAGVAIADSKTIYSPNKGISSLALGVRVAQSCVEQRAGSTCGSLSELIPECDASDLARDAWTCGESRREDSAADSELAAGLRQALQSRGISILSIAARAMSVRAYNKALAAGNKADVNWRVAAQEIRRVFAFARPDETVVVLLDRQGGRKFYAPLLCELFGCALAEIEIETEQISQYRLNAGDRTIRAGFFVDGDVHHLPIALASMCAKLARELIMLRINSFFQRHAPGLKGTAGYYADGQRFLRDTLKLRKSLGIPDAHFIRER